MSILADSLVGLYNVWHGHLHLKGCGQLLRLAAKYYAPLREYPVKVNGIGTTHVDFRDMSAYSLMNLNFRDEHHHEYLIYGINELLSEGDCFWDVGANAGVITAGVLRHHGPQVNIAAFEPNPRIYAVLETLLNKWENAACYNSALGATASSLTLYINSTDSTLSSLQARRLPEGQDTSVEVEIDTADHVMSSHHLPPPAVIKIDVEGFEPDVLNGMKHLIAAHRPVIFFEHLFMQQEEIRTACPDNYCTYYLRADGRITQNPERSRPGHNAIYVPCEKESVIMNIYEKVN